MRTILILLSSIYLALGMMSCKTQNMFAEEMTNKQYRDGVDSLLLYNPDYQYTIRKDDKITISIWGKDDWSVGSTYGIYNSNEVYGKWLMVDAEGIIEVPKIGSVYVENLTIIDLKKKLKQAMGEWLVNPIVDIKILNKEISLLGEFRDPAVITVDKDRNYLLEMITRVGGFDNYANLEQVKVLRQIGVDTQVINIDLTKKGDYRYRNIPLYPGDIVIATSVKYKTFDKRISTIIPFTSAITAAAIFMKAF